jgi:hypothetical protein
MKSIISKTSGLLALAVMLLSFTPRFGGEGYEIFLNGKPVLKQYNKEMNAIRTLQINELAPNDLLTIRYYHCGKVAKNRVVSIKDGQGKLLKEFWFKDAFIEMGDMNCTVKELTGLKKGRILQIHYASSELPGGRQLALLSFSGNNDHAKAIK